MSRPVPGLTPAAVNLLLELLEQQQPVLSAAAAPLAEGADALLRSGLLIRAGDEAVIASLDDHEDVPVSLFPTGEDGAVAYYSPSSGPVIVPPEQLQMHRVDLPKAFALLAVELALPRGWRPMELVEGLLWEIGHARLPGRKARIPVWFARRLSARRVVQAVAVAALARPHLDLRVLLSNTDAERAIEISIPGMAVVSVRDVLARADGLAIDPAILAARLGMPPLAAKAPGPVVLSADGTKLTINGRHVADFRSAKQIDAIRQLVKAYYAGDRLRARDLTEFANLESFFGKRKWALLAPHLESEDGAWGFKP
jgi:hypothetical protein